MIKCPKCRAEANTPITWWPVLARKSFKDEESRMIMAVFECLNCKTHFRTVLKAEPGMEETANIKNLVERLKGIKAELMQTLRNLREKIMTLETERANLMGEIDKLKEDAESRVSALESEISTLRDEVSSLKDLLGFVEEPKKQT